MPAEARENSKLEVRNSKQIQMITKHKIPNTVSANLEFGKFSNFGLFRISKFEFRICESV